MNSQARVKHSGGWRNYGPVGLLEAARREAIAWHTGLPNVGRSNVTIELRDADDPRIPLQTVTVRVEAVATVINPRGGE